MKKEEFITGKWYNVLENCYFKFSKFDGIINKIMPTDTIHQDRYLFIDITNNDWWEKDPIPLSDLEVIQKFLPEGHPDKKEEEMISQYYIRSTSSGKYLNKYITPVIRKKKNPSIEEDSDKILGYIFEDKYVSVGHDNGRGEYEIPTKEDIEWLEVCILDNKFIPREEALKPKPMNTYGLNIGDHLPAKILDSWISEGPNWHYTKGWEKMTKNRFTDDRKILSFKDIDGVIGFLASGCLESLHLRAEGFKEFMDNFDKLKPIEYSNYYKCINKYLGFKEQVGKIYKRESNGDIHYNREHDVVCTHGPRNILQWFIPSTKEEYEAQFVKKEEIMEKKETFFIQFSDEITQELFDKLVKKLTSMYGENFQHCGQGEGILQSFKTKRFLRNDSVLKGWCIDNNKQGFKEKFIWDFIEKEEIKVKTMKKVEDLAYPDVIHIKSKEEWDRASKFTKLSSFNSEMFYYLAPAHGLSKTPYIGKAGSVANYAPYVNYEFEDIIFPEEKPIIMEKPSKILIFNDIYVGDVVVSLTDNNYGYREKGSIHTAGIESGKNSLQYNTLAGKGDSTKSTIIEDWRKATLEETEAYNKGIRNIKDIKVPEKPISYEGRWIEALVDYPHAGAVRKGEYGQIIDDIASDANFPSQNPYSITLDEKLYKLMPEGWSPKQKEEKKFHIGDVVTYKEYTNLIILGFDKNYINCVVGGKKGGHSGHTLNYWHDEDGNSIPYIEGEGRYYLDLKSISKTIPKMENDDWCILLTPENKNDIITYFNAYKGVKHFYTGSGGYYGIRKMKDSCEVSNWGKLLTTEEFYAKIGKSIPVPTPIIPEYVECINTNNSESWKVGNIYSVRSSDTSIEDEKGVFESSITWNNRISSSGFRFKPSSIEAYDKQQRIQQIKEKFPAIPKKWCLAVTKENKEILGRWRTIGTLVNNNGYIMYPNYSNGVKGYWMLDKPSDCTEITFEQFKQYVLKEPVNQQIMEKDDDLPKKGEFWIYKNSTTDEDLEIAELKNARIPIYDGGGLYIGDEVEFITNSNYIPSWEANDSLIPNKFIKHGMVQFKKNNGKIEHIYNEYYLVSFEDTLGKTVQLGFKKEVLRKKNSETVASVNIGAIKIQSEVSTLHIPKSASVTLKNTENEVKINVKQLNSIKIN